MKIGVVGAGGIGQLRIQSVRDNPSTELAAVFDVSAEAATRAVAGTGARVCTDLQSFFDVDMDAAIVSTPPHVHEEACVGSFERGRHVLCEKPLSNTVDAARRIVDAAHRSGKFLGVGFNFRYYPCIAFVKDAITQGRIGRVDHLRVFGGHDGLANFRADWQYRAPESGGGAMMDVGIHLSDLARHLLGDVTRVYGVMSESVWNVPGSEDNAVAVFMSPGGVPATYHATWNEWKGYEVYVEAYGSRGMVRGSYAPMYNLLITQDRPGAARSRTVRRYPEIMVREKIKSWKSTALLSFKDELRDFLTAATNSASVALADGHDGLRALEVAAAVRQSTMTGQAVELAPLGRMRG
jgi:predicted dehydrogenase